MLSLVPERLCSYMNSASLFLEGTPLTRLQKTVLTTEQAAVVLAKIRGILGERTWAHGESAGLNGQARPICAEIARSRRKFYRAAESMLKDTLVVYIRERREASGGTRVTTRSEKAACTPLWC